MTSIDGEISIASWSPDGRKLLCTIRKTDAEALEREKDEQKKKLGVVVRHYTRLFYKMDGYGYLPHERTHIWLIDVRTGKGKQLTDGSIHDETFPTFSPDGRTIAFVSNRTEEPDAYPDYDDIFIMPADGGTPRKLKTPIGGKYMLSFSPDGKLLAYFSSEGENLHYKNTCLWIVPVDGSQPAKNLTEKYDLHTQAVITDFGASETVPPAWSNDGKSIYFQAAVHGSTVLKRIDIAGKNMTDVIGEGGALGTLSFDKSQKQVAYFYGSMQDTPQVHNPFVRELYAFPDKGVIVPVVSVDGWSRIMNSHDQFDGMEFKQDDQACTCIIYRKDRSHPTSATEYMDECKRDNSPAWKSHPRRMLRHKAMIQVARLAFGFTGIYDQDEAERIIEVKEIDVTPGNKSIEEKRLPDYPDAKFEANKTAWEAAINSEKHTTQSIINMISTKHTLSEEQKIIIRSLGVKDERAT